MRFAFHEIREAWERKFLEERLAGQEPCFSTEATAMTPGTALGATDAVASLLPEVRVEEIVT